MSSQVTVKVLSYNVYMRNQAPDTPIENIDVYNKLRASLIPDFIVRSDIDVVVFQEAFDDGARDIMMRELRNDGKFHHSTYVVGFDDRLTKSDGGVFIMSRWPIVYQGQIVYETGGVSWDRFARKGVSWAAVEKQGCYFNVFGTHTQSGGDTRAVVVRRKQLTELRRMVDKVGLYWPPALIVGDLNVDFCTDADRLRGVCSPQERDDMLTLLKASMPQDRSRYAYTSDPANVHLKDDHRPTTLDYVLFSNTHRPPVRSSIETLKPRAVVDFPVIGRKEVDLSDHYAVVATATFEKKREDTPLFLGDWKRVLFNGKPAAAECLVTFGPLGLSVVATLKGKVVTNGRIEQMFPGAELAGRLRLWNGISKAHEEWHYRFNKNRDYEQYFIPGDGPLERRPRPFNELTLRGPGITQTFAFVSWPEVDGPERPGRPE